MATPYHRPHPTRRLVATAVSALLATPALAARDELGQYLQMDLSELMAVEVTTPSLLGETVHRAPGSVTVVTRQQIRNRGYRNLAELLTDLPGVDIQNYSDGTSFNRIALRGVVGNNKFLILQDGFRIDSPTGESIPVMGNFPLYHVKQVEVVYGPASAIYGADAFTGVINIITAAPGEITENELALSAGEFGYRYGHFNGALRINDQAAFTLGGHVEKSDNPDLQALFPGDFADPSGGAPYDQPTRDYSLNGRLDLGQALTVGWNRSFFRGPTSVGNPPVDPADAQLIDYGAGADYRTLLQTLYATYDWEIGDGLSGRLLMDYSSYEVEPESEFVNKWTNLQHLGYKYSEGRRFRIEPRLTWEFDDHKVVAGLSFEDLHSLPKTANLPRPYDGGVFYYPGTSPQLPIEIFEVDYSNVGLFAQASSRWGDTVTTTIGARYDDNSVYGESFTPRLSIAYSPSEATTWELAYGESFLAPAPFYRYENYGAFDPTHFMGPNNSWFFHVPNPDLEPEQLKSLEFSIQHRASANLDLSATLYHQRVEGLIGPTNTPIVVSGFVPGGTIGFTTHNDNLGTLETNGAELGFNYVSRWSGAELSWWGSLSWLDGELTKPDGTVLKPPYTSEYKLKTGLTASFGNRWVVSPRLRWIGEAEGGEDAQGAVGNTGTTPTYAVVDLHAERRDLLPGIDLTLDVKNLFDKRYYNAGDGNNAFASTPQDPRWIQLGVRYRF